MVNSVISAILLCFIVAAPANTAHVAASRAGLYIVHLSGKYPPAATYEGGIRGFPATAPRVTSGLLNRLTGRPRLNSQAAHVRAYTSFLRQLHRGIARKVKLQLSNLLYSYDIVANAFAARLTPSLVKRLQRHPLVLAVERSQVIKPSITHSPQFLNLDTSLWVTAGGQSNAGAGVVVGVVDTGIWPENPFFDGTDFTSATPPSTWTGKCNSTSDFPSSLCNKKLIGANYFYAGAQAYSDIDLSSDWLSPRDAEGHGTWCASASAGNRGTTIAINSTVIGTGSGMAPRAFLAAYKAFWTTVDGSLQGSATSADLFAAVNQAVADGVDVLSCSWGGPVNDYISSAQYMFLNALKAGVFTSIAAGNEGPTPATINNPSPFTLTVGASTTDRTTLAIVTYNTSATVNVPTNPTMSAALTSPLIAAASCAKQGANASEASLCCQGTLDPSKCSGKIVVCDRGEVYFTVKIAEVQSTGASGVIITNVEGGLSGQFALSDSFPVAHIDVNDGKAIKSYIQSTTSPTASISAPQTTFNNEAPLVATFSSRGPTVRPSKLFLTRFRLSNDILKPDIIGPGVALFGAWAGLDMGANSVQFKAVSGTSMSTPHLAGIAALIIQQHPDWSPSQVKSAIMTTAYTVTNKGNPIFDQTGLSVTPWDTGSGHVDCTKVVNPGLTYDSTFDDYVNFLYARQPWLAPRVFRGSFSAVPSYNLNYPNIVVGFLSGGSVVVTRTVTNVGGVDAVYNATVVEPSNVQVVVSPSTLSVSKGGTATFTVTFNVKSRSRNFAFGSLTWADGNGHVVRSVLGVQAI